MKLPWRKSTREDRIEELESKVEELEEKNRSLKERWKAEEQRRSEASRRKQEAEKKVKDLETRLETLQNRQQSDRSEETEGDRFENISVMELKKGLRKLGTVNSESGDLLSVISPAAPEKLDGYRELRNTVSARYTSQFQNIDRFACFTDGRFFRTVLKIRPIFDSHWSLSERFETRKILSMIDREKTWVVVSAGNSRVIREKGGEILEDEKIETRVNHQHSQGGFSQGRFERKREEQIEEHLELVRQSVEDQEFLVVGEERLAKNLDGEYAGGFDPERSTENALYGFQIRT
ncbi:MAG: Vms1/Ankzf1 family peptidyl-tRNA hydrolase [Candidatus Nanohaloarchaea archaeon]